MKTDQMVETDDFDEVHWAIIDEMLDGRHNDEPWGFAAPETLARTTGESRQLINNRLRDLIMADVVEKRSRGFYKLNPEEVPDRDA